MRKNIVSYFMGIAIATAERSTCIDKQVGAVVINETNQIVSTGYNGSPRYLPNCCDKYDEEFPCPKDCGEPCIAIHAEANALLQAGKEAHRGTLFVTLEPCYECAKLAINAGIKEIIFLNKNSKKQDYKDLVATLLTLAFVKLTQHTEYKGGK